MISTINVAVAGILLALALLWTSELALPIGLHLSWNFCQGNVFGFPVLIAVWVRVTRGSLTLRTELALWRPGDGRSI